MLSGGAIAGIVIGCLVAVAAAATVLLIIWKRRSKRIDRGATPSSSSIRALSFRFTRENKNRTESDISATSAPTYYAKATVNTAHSEVGGDTSADGACPESGYAYIKASGRPAAPFAQPSDAGEHPYELSSTFPPVKLTGTSQLSVVTLNSEDHQVTAATYDSLASASPLGISTTSSDAGNVHVKAHAKSHIHVGHVTAAAAAAAAAGVERKLSIPEPDMYEQPIVRKSSKHVRCSDGDPENEYDEAMIVGGSDKSGPAKNPNPTAAQRGYDDPTSLRKLAAAKSGASLFRENGNAATASNNAHFEQNTYDDPVVKEHSRHQASGSSLKPVTDYLIPADEVSATHA